jgi:hypothetical protein
VAKPEEGGLQQGPAADAGPAPPAAADVAGVRHVIDVTLVSASGLPDAADMSGAQQPVPDKRFVKYSFPGGCDNSMHKAQCAQLCSPGVWQCCLLQPSTNRGSQQCRTQIASSAEHMLCCLRKAVWRCILYIILALWFVCWPQVMSPCTRRRLSVCQRLS